MSEIYTASEAADILSVHIDTIRRWSDDGKLPFEKTPGGHRRYRKSDLDQILNGCNKSTSIAHLMTTEEVDKKIKEWENKSKDMDYILIGNTETNIDEKSVGDFVILCDSFCLMKPDTKSICFRVSEVLGYCIKVNKVLWINNSMVSRSYIAIDDASGEIVYYRKYALVNYDEIKNVWWAIDRENFKSLRIPANCQIDPYYPGLVSG